MQPGELKLELSVPAEEFAERREFVRRSVLRANRAIAVILGVVVLLGVVLVVMIMRARQSQVRAERAEAEETERLWKASLAQARAEILSTQMGHREAALEAVRTAAKIRPSLELRNEALAALAQRDLVPEREWKLRPNAYGFNFDPDLKYYVVRNTEEVLSMFRLEDNAPVRDFPMPSFLPKGSNVGDFVFSATGKYVVIRYNGGAVVLYETETGNMARVIGRDPQTVKYSWPPSFTADDRLMCLSMTGSGGVMVLYDIEKGEPRTIAGLPEKFTYTGGFTNYLRLSPRGDLIAWYEGANVHVFDAATGAPRQSITGPSIVQTATWDEQGDRFAFSCDNFTLFVWEAKSGRVVQMGGSAITPWMQRFSRDGTVLMTSGSDGVTRLWEVNTSRLICESSGVLGHTLSHDGRRLAWGVPGLRVGVWRIEHPAAMTQRRGSVVERATVWQQDLSPDGRFAVWSPPGWLESTGYELLDLERGGSVLVPTKSKGAVGFRPAHGQVWTTGPDSLTFRSLPADGLTDAAALEANTESLPLPENFGANNASFTADGKTAAVSGANGAVIVVHAGAPEKPVRLEGRYLSHASTPGPGSPTGSGAMAISPDGRWVVAGRYVDRGNPVVWDAHTGKIVHRLPCTEAHVAFSPDGRFLATVGAKTGRIWSTGDWKVIWQRERDSLLQFLGAAAFTADGSLMAWSRGSTRVELVTSAGETLAEWNLRSLDIVAGLRFSADGGRLFAGGTEGRMLSLDVKTLRGELAAMNLDWPLPRAAGRPASTGAPATASHWMPALLGLVPVGIAAVLGGLVLRRQGRLTREFVEATEVAAKRARELAAEREVSELKSRFVSTVSHEFRTPLGITMSAIELMRHYGDKLDDAQREQLYDDIYSATRNMAGLMEQVLVLGRVDAGKLAFCPAPLDLDTLARKLTDESLSATNRKCPIHWTAENDLSRARGDEALLRHIFTNLLSNAVKYSPDGAEVNFTGRREADIAVFTIEDHGIGIPDKDLPHLFEAFHRGGNVGEIPGTGLGLVIIKRCVDLHGGSISVETKPGEGTTFTVRVPAWGESA